MKTNIYLQLYLAQLFSEWENFQENFVDEIKNTFYVQ